MLIRKAYVVLMSSILYCFFFLILDFSNSINLYQYLWRVSICVFVTDGYIHEHVATVTKRWFLPYCILLSWFWLQNVDLVRSSWPLFIFIFVCLIQNILSVYIFGGLYLYVDINQITLPFTFKYQKLRNSYFGKWLTAYSTNILKWRSTQVFFFFFHVLECYSHTTNTFS